MKLKIIVILFFLGGSILADSCKHDLPADTAATSEDDHGHDGSDDNRGDHSNGNGINLCSGNSDTISLQNVTVNN